MQYRHIDFDRIRDAMNAQVCIELGVKWTDEEIRSLALTLDTRGKEASEAASLALVKAKIAKLNGK